jgi:hypothetical protein
MIRLMVCDLHFITYEMFSFPYESVKFPADFKSHNQYILTA